MADQNPSTDSYPIGYGNYALARLDLQHFHLIEDFDGNLIDPSIPHHSQDLKIADLCCGTGIWLLQVSRRLPKSTALLALDINTAQLPPQPFLPSNISTLTFDIFAPPPSHLIGTLDIINIQIVFVIIPDTQIQAVLQNILSLLKPGGYLQWTEDIPTAFESFSPDPNHEPKYLLESFDRGWELLGLTLPRWPETLGSQFGNAGFENVDVIERIGDRGLAKSFMGMGFMGYEELAVSYLSRTGGGEKPRQKVSEYRDLIERARGEVAEHGVAARLKVVRVIGRKKLG